ncbi:MAG: nitrate- and nitrite sensing domain-containing protein [Gammaproteobacteria bacterium]|nr:nitrate- and nitrite sensing domain-containing protein [Gammaproteobacteria bacterium]
MDIHIVTVVVLIIVAMALHFSRQSSEKKKQLSGLSIIVKIKTLMSLVQQHRGLSSAWLNGDQSKLPILKNMEQKIGLLCGEINETGIENINVRWRGFLDHWSRLTRKSHDTDVTNNFKQHTQMISNLLYLLEDEAERAHLTPSAIPELPSIGFVWRELVSTAESVGQSRAIGTGVATAKSCSSVDKIRLSFLEKHINSTCSDMLKKLTCLEQFSGQHANLLSSAQDKMKRLINTIEHDLIQASKVSIDQNDYFNLASDTITSLDNIFNSQVEQVKMVLTQ